jgi:hypothetical protein
MLDNTNSVSMKPIIIENVFLEKITGADKRYIRGIRKKKLLW